MRLIRVVLRDFLRWGSLDLELGGLGGVVVTGDNGLGKTSIVEAVLWALYGESRFRDADKVVKIGRTDASVTIDFEAAGERHRVTRKRTARGRGKTELDLYRRDGTGPAGPIWTPLSGKNIADTQAEIVRVLGVSHDTLVATSVIAQGDAGRFTRARPEERRAVLREILGLEAWKERATQARARARTEEALADALAREVEGAAEIEARRAETAEALGRSAVALAAARAVAETCTADVATARERDTRARATLQAAQARAADRPRHEAALDAARRELVGLGAEEDRLRTAARTDVIEQAERDVPAALARLADAERRSAEAQAVEERRSDLQRQRDALLTRWQDADRRRRVAEQEASGIDEVRARASGVDACVSAERDATAALRAVDETLSSLERAARTIDDREDVAAARHARDEAHRTLTEARRRRDGLAEAPGALTAARMQADATRLALARAEVAADRLRQVPCGQADGWTPTDGLGIDVREGDRCDLAGTCPLLADARAAAAQLHGLGESLAAAEAAVGLAERDAEAHAVSLDVERDARASADAAETAHVELRRQALDDLDGRRQRAVADMRSAREVLDRARDALRAAEGAAARLPSLEAATVRAGEARAEAGQIAAEGQALKTRADEIPPDAFDHAGHVALLRFQVGQLQATAARRPAAEQAAADLARIPARRAAVEARAADAEESIRACAVPAAVRSETEEAAAALRAAEESERRLRSVVETCQRDHSTATATLDRIDADLAALAGKRAEVDRLRGVVADWRATVEACEVAPTLLIERAIPLLEAEANRVLADVSPRGLRVRVETQRALKSGDGMTETLEIIARDEAGELPYEGYSGGTKVRIDMAFRLALAKLMTDRDGVPVEWLVVDEGGFGELDASGRAALKETIAALQPRYALIMLVTHIEDLVDTLPHRLHVEDDGAGGSRLASGWAAAPLEEAA